MIKAENFPHTKQIEVAFHDIDAMGHVNNVVYLIYLETVRIDYMWNLFQFSTPSDVPIVLGEVHCRYLTPAHYRDVLTVGIGASRFGRKSFDFVYRIDLPDGRPVLQATTTMVTFDYEMQRSIIIPAWLREGIETYQNAWSWTGFDDGR